MNSLHKTESLFPIEELNIFFKNWKFLNFSNKYAGINKVVIDSRSVGKDNLFIAIKGENNDGHKYIKQAIDNGAICIICEKIPDDLNINNYNDICFIIVNNSIIALQDLARFQRSRLTAKVIGITGNIGKTTTREMIKLATECFFKTEATKGNYNNHIGLPLTIVNTNTDVQCLVLEMGMNHVGEIDFLTKIAKPDIAVITKIAPAHIGNFKDIHEIVNAKAEIFNGMSKEGAVVLDGDGEFFNDFKNIANKKGITNIRSVGFCEKNNISIKNIEYCKDFTTQYVISVNGHKFDCKITGFAEHNVFNSLFAFAVCDILNIDLNKVVDCLTKFRIVKGRGNFEEKNISGKKITIINDCYNSSPEALKSSIKTLAEIKKLSTKSRCVAVIGDMLELGEKSKQYHANIAKVLIEYEIDHVVCIGEDSFEIFNNLPETCNKLFFKTTDEFCGKILSYVKNEDILLLKASHGMHFDKLIEVLNDNNDYKN